MKLVALMKAQAPSKCFAQPQAAQTPSCDTWVLLQSASRHYANSSAEGKHFPLGWEAKRAVSISGGLAREGHQGMWLCTTQFLGNSCQLMHGRGVLLQSMLGT